MITTFLSALPRRLLALLAVPVWLAACGGGTSQVEAFAPSRLITLGDELSAFTADGRKYTVNGFAADGVTRDCTALPLWTQVVASIYGFGFAECPVGTGEQKAVSRATAGARVSDLQTQVAQQVAAGGFNSRDLVTVLVGTNDVRELYAQSLAPTLVSEADLTQLARTRGEAIAAQVNAMVALGAKVIVATVPDLGLSPYGIAQEAASPGAAGLLTRLTAALNGRIRAGILNDGRFVGLVLADELVQTAALAPGVYSLTDAKSVACAVALPDCSTQTLVTGATAETWLWADDTWFGAGGHLRLGQVAEARARNNPF